MTKFHAFFLIICLTMIGFTNGLKCYQCITPKSGSSAWCTEPNDEQIKVCDGKDNQVASIGCITTFWENEGVKHAERKCTQKPTTDDAICKYANKGDPILGLNGTEDTIAKFPIKSCLCYENECNNQSWSIEMEQYSESSGNNFLNYFNVLTRNMLTPFFYFKSYLS